MANFHSFQKLNEVMVKRGTDFKKNAAELTRRIATVIGETVAKETPVDTGTARSNWIMTRGAPASYSIPAYVPYRKTHQVQYAVHKATGPHPGGGLGDKEEVANLEAVKAQHTAALAAYNPDTDKTVYLANNVIYIGRLNDGYSPQTAAGFVERAVKRGIEAAWTMRLMPDVVKTP